MWWSERDIGRDEGREITYLIEDFWTYLLVSRINFNIYIVSKNKTRQEDVCELFLPWLSVIRVLGGAGVVCPVAVGVLVLEGEDTGQSSVSYCLTRHCERQGEEGMWQQVWSMSGVCPLLGLG